jgi:hypothetical protein
LRLILKKSLAGDADWEDLQRAMQEIADDEFSGKESSATGFQG